jgi:putative Mn2+ efflux pump MntP
MSIVSYIVIALAMGVVNMLFFRRSAEATPIRLSEGLLVILAQSAIHSVLFYLGGLIGVLLSMYSPSDPAMYADVNAYIFLGMVLVVIIKMLFPYLRKEPRLPVFNLAKGSVLAFSGMIIVTGINVFLVGVGAGFTEMENPLHKMIWPMFGMSFVFGYLGLMFGRQKVAMRPRRWMILACVLLLGTAIAAVVNAR